MEGNQEGSRSAHRTAALPTRYNDAESAEPYAETPMSLYSQHQEDEISPASVERVRYPLPSTQSLL